MHLLALVLLLSLPPVALAAPGWTDTESLPLDFDLEPSTGYADGGVELVAHLEVEGTTNDIHTVLIVTRRAPGDDATEELRLTSTPTAVPAGMRLCVAASGAAVLAFAERTSNDLDPVPPLRWRAAYRDASGTWESPVTLFTDLDDGPPVLRADERSLCAVAPDGTAVAGATHLELDDTPTEPAPDQTDFRLDLAVRPAGGAWQAAQRLSPANMSSLQAALDVDDGGNFLVAWSSRWTEGASDDDGDDKHTVLVRKLLAGSATWSGVEDVTGPDAEVSMSVDGVALGRTGRAVIAFTAESQAWAATRDDASTPFGSPVQLVSSGETSRARAATVADDGAAYVLYAYGLGLSLGEHVGIVKRTPGGSWTDEYPVSPLPFVFRDAGLACIGSDAIAVWSGRGADDRSVVLAARWPAGAGIPDTYEEIDERADIVTFETVRSDRAGGVVAIWGNGDEGRRRAVYDAGAPALTASTVPSGIVAGVPATFAASFVDVWSPLAGEPAWQFADGGTASGGSVAHTFANPGDYTVTATVADTFGNTRVSSFPVTVSACESLAGVEAVSCRCGNGLVLGIAACDGATLPTAVGKKFVAACDAVGAAQGGSGKKARKAAARAAKSFKKAARVLAGKKGKAVAAPCRDALAAVLGAARDRATELKGAP